MAEVYTIDSFLPTIHNLTGNPTAIYLNSMVDYLLSPSYCEIRANVSYNRVEVLQEHNKIHLQLPRRSGKTTALADILLSKFHRCLLFNINQRMQEYTQSTIEVRNRNKFILSRNRNSFINESNGNTLYFSTDIMNYNIVNDRTNFDAIVVDNYFFIDKNGKERIFYIADKCIERNINCLLILIS